jgi:hypothetical protein
MSGSDSLNANISIEATPSGQNLPEWLFQELISSNPPELLIIHPSDRARKETLSKLSKVKSSIDTSKHLTIQRLFATLHLDFRLPNLMDDDALMFSLTHDMVQKHAQKGNFPLMFSPFKDKQWTEYKTQRLQQLHRELSEIKSPWKWESDPGVKEFSKLLSRMEARTKKTHPHLMKNHLLERIKQAIYDAEIPFSLRSTNGIIMLDHPPEFSEMDRELLIHISHTTPIHQLCAPGSFRLGFHGAYIEDIDWTDRDSLPTWLPQHEVWNYPKNVTWISPEGESKKTILHRVSLERREHSIEATFQLLSDYLNFTNKNVLIIDAAAESNRRIWSSRLKEIGIISSFGPQSMNEQPAISSLINLLQVGEGLEAWSFEKFRRIVENNGLPLTFASFSELIHPKEADWKPYPHLDVLEKISRSFHVLGGPGALIRWIRILEKATPILGDDVPSMRKKLEETLWWFANIVKIWAPLYEDASTASSQIIIGCSTGIELPTIHELKNGTEWLNLIYHSVDWDTLSMSNANFSNSISALQKLNQEHHRLFSSMTELNFEVPHSGRDFIKHVERIIDNTKLSNSRIKSKNIEILTPHEAFGLESDLIILAGLDVDSWSMKSPKIPWLDSEARLQLGILNSDIEIRKGRHHLKHLINAAKEVIILDSSEDESAGPSAPLVEFLEEMKRIGNYDTLSKIPSFIPLESYIDGWADRPWHLCSHEDDEEEIWLTPRPYSMSMSSQGAVGHRSGNRGRDFMQRAGLKLLHGESLESIPISINNLAQAHEFTVINDRLKRQPSHKNIEKQEYLDWSVRNSLVSVDKLTLRPTISQVKEGSKNSKIWPHLGIKGSKSNGPAIDPRPLPIFQSKSKSFQSITGTTNRQIGRKVWSASRIQSWLSCPRQAWLFKHLGASQLEQPTEDIDNRTRGLLIHDIEAAILEKHGIIIAGEASSNPVVLSKGPLNNMDKLWGVALEYLEEEATWLARSNAVAHHRCRDMLGVTSEIWAQSINGELDIYPAGRIGRMLEADLLLRNSAPIACEWELSQKGKNSLTIEAKSDDGSILNFDLFGRIDRVDCVILDEEMRQKAISDGVLSDEESDQKRWVIIRDMKSLDGPKEKEKGDRHRRAIFDEVQLALYAKAWETANPNDRVVGVGITEIGETTTHYVELDHKISKYIADASLGDQTYYTSLHYRPLKLIESKGESGFRDWIDERLRTVARVIIHADSGYTQPMPGKHCSYCSVRTMCPSAELGGDEK